MARGLSKSPTSNKLSVTFFLLFMGFAFYISCVGFHERTDFTPGNTVRHYCGDEEESDNEANYEYDEDLLQEGFYFPSDHIRYVTHTFHDTDTWLDKDYDLWHCIHRYNNEPVRPLAGKIYIRHIFHIYNCVIFPSWHLLCRIYIYTDVWDVV